MIRSFVRVHSDSDSIADLYLKKNGPVWKPWPRRVCRDRSAELEINVYRLKNVNGTMFICPNCKYRHLKSIILDCMGTFCRSKDIKATALNFSIFRHT